MTVLTPTASVWAVATRLTALDAEGYPDPGNAMYVSEQLIKLTATPVMETGDDIAIKNASGDLSVFAKHGDMIKYGTVQLDLAIPDPALEQLFCGGTLLGSSSAALGLVTGATAVGQITLGELAAGTYGYRISQYNAFGESLAAADFSGSVASGVAGRMVIGGPIVMAAGALGCRVYGRTIGTELFLGTIPNIGTQETNAAVTAAEHTSLVVKALTESIPKGTTFQLEGDTNSPKITFKTSAFAPKGVISLPIEAVTPGTEIATTKKLQPVFVDSGALTPSGNLPQADQTAGPGENTGYNASELGPVANPNGISVECFGKAIIHGRQATEQPFIHWIFPRVQNGHIMPREVTNANTQTMMEGQAEENPNWSSGPVGDWPFASGRWYGRARCGRAIVPKASYENTPATL